MTEEEYERIKQREKEHLRKMKALRQKVHRLQRAKKTEQDAAESAARARELLDESTALARRLDAEAAQSGARLDLASGDTSGVGSSSASDSPDDPEARARDLVRRLRDETETEDAGTDASEGDRFDKTIGPAT